MVRRTVAMVRYCVPFLCCLVSFFLYSVFLYAQDTQTTSYPFIPSHETAIRMVAVHDGFLYVLDANGLLTITKTFENRRLQKVQSSSDSYRVLYRKHAIHDAMFSYPYIVFTNTTGMLCIYNIAQRYMVFSASYRRGTGYAFSPSKRLFSYIDESGLVVVSTETWDSQHNHIINGIPSYIAISNTEKNIMLYDENGTIVYKNMYTGEVLKRISTVDALQHLAMNTTRRFAVGISGNSLSVVDLVNGQMVDTIVISSFPTRIFALQNSNKIISLSTFSDNSQMLRMFNFSNDGKLVEQDVLNVENVENVSTLFFEEKKIYLGFEDGSLSVYTMRDKTLNAILFDKTIANYDAVISQNTIFFANADGVRSIALSSLIEGSQEKALISPLISQTLISPIFVPSSSPQSLPYVVSRARTVSLLFQIHQAQNGHVSLLPPMQLSFLPSTVVAGSLSLFAYSQQHATGSLLYYAPTQETDASHGDVTQSQGNSSVDAGDGMLHNSNDFLINHPSIAFHFDSNSTLFTSAPLYEQADAKVPSNLLYAYRVLKKKFKNSGDGDTDDTNLFVKEHALKLPFSMEDILYIRHIPSQSSRRFILVRKVRPRLENDASMEILLVDYPINIDDAHEATRIRVLAREKYDEAALFLYQISGDTIKIVTLARDCIFLTTAHARTGNAILHTSMPYPHKVSRVISAHITGSFLTAVDVNNLAFVAEISDFFVTITWLMMLTEMNNGSVKLLTERLR